VTRPPNASTIEAAFTAPFDPHKPAHLIHCSRFDQFSESTLEVAPSNLLQVAGQAFFIMNGDPVYFMHAIWLMLDPPTEVGKAHAQKGTWVIPRQFGMAIGYLAECGTGLIGKQAGFTRYQVGYSCATWYHNIEKGRRVLGYVPEVGLEEGVWRMVEVSLLPFSFAHS
jgi:sterol-4alpha-carboxylate 3-dehydrogenase (decarboxylating)